LCWRWPPPATRSSFWLVGHHITIPKRVQEMLRYAPACALAAIVAPDLMLAANGQPVLDEQPETGVRHCRHDLLFAASQYAGNHRLRHGFLHGITTVACNLITEKSQRLAVK
jgi:hypothetical protein